MQTHLLAVYGNIVLRTGGRGKSMWDDYGSDASVDL